MEWIDFGLEKYTYATEDVIRITNKFKKDFRKATLKLGKLDIDNNKRKKLYKKCAELITRW